MDIELLQKIHFLNNLILPKFPKIYLKTHIKQMNEKIMLV